jgi:hypothetical protein
MELPTKSIYQQYHTLVVFGRQSFLLPLIPNNKFVFIIYLEDYLRNMMTYSANILVFSTDTYNSLY